MEITFTDQVLKKINNNTLKAGDTIIDADGELYVKTVKALFFSLNRYVDANYEFLIQPLRLVDVKVQVEVK